MDNCRNPKRYFFKSESIIRNWCVLQTTTANPLWILYIMTTVIVIVIISVTISITISILIP